MAQRIKNMLEKGERLLWCTPGAGRRDARGSAGRVAVMGGLIFTAAAAGLLAALWRDPAVSLPAAIVVSASVALAGDVFWVIWWAYKRDRSERRVPNVYFVTDRRAGVIPHDGGVRQIPLLPEVKINFSEDRAEFRLEGQPPITIENVPPGHMSLLQAALEQLRDVDAGANEASAEEHGLESDAD